MSVPVPDCPRCRIRMEAGFVMDFSVSEGMRLPRWIEGTPEKGFLRRFKVKGKRQFDLTAYRCNGCGYLIWFAPAPPGETS